MPHFAGGVRHELVAGRAHFAPVRVQAGGDAALVGDRLLAQRKDVVAAGRLRGRSNASAGLAMSAAVSAPKTRNVRFIMHSPSAMALRHQQR
jgi:hypothetical protein